MGGPPFGYVGYPGQAGGYATGSGMRHLSPNTPGSPPTFPGICAADWTHHFACGTFVCVECAAPFTLPATNNGPVHDELCPVCGCAYAIPLRGSFAGGNGAVTFQTATAYGSILREDFLAALSRPAALLTMTTGALADGGDAALLADAAHTWTAPDEGLAVHF